MLPRFFVSGGIDWGVGRIGRRCFPGGLTAGLQLLVGLHLLARQQFSTCGHVALAMRIAVAAEATCLRVALRKNVHGPATDELSAGEAYVFGFVAAAGLCSLPGSERDVPVLVTNEYAIRNRTASHVPSQVFQYLIGRGVRRRRSLDVSAPFHIFKRLEPVFKRGGSLQVLPLAVELQFASGLQST